MIPLSHDFEGERVLVVGGGRVGARKARRFAAEADVVVVSPGFADAAFGGAERIRAEVAPGDVPGWFDRVDPVLAVAATDDGALNARVESVAHERGVLVNRTDTHGGRDAGSVVVPATVRDDPVVVSIATGGTSPALSRYLRERVEDELDGAGAMAELTGALREDLQARGVDPERRRDVVRAVVRSPDVWTTLRTGNAKPRQLIDDVLADVAPDLANS
ncbi:bifunctional precorrin-2 dehydrogenase/sirohydrochlorin ferrochelatase [Halorubellus sp. JP-L1]|uniref:precorrin-2 dehydrogenase/sirohydrochlorin ferrochelatase family protein n=1 Tax=Halorubellus sp. JP-L1 TaxID=2715753 RepID=UPI0014092247|nr:NAD(P)-dependent oxidoreductase [Halorubellus sp. JP-L1]NHN41335.1 bifunctional precorrin-2 dehydrogenase/sirohydrochlorin ferrochelatase [Halorubellus sp. JP-L1]